MTSTETPLPQAAIEILRDLSPEDRATVLANATQRKIRRGEVLVRQGEAADCVYYVLRGKFEVLRDNRHVVAEIGPGEPIGEIAFFAGLTRTADVIAVRDSDTLELDRAAYEHISRLVPAFTQSILRTFGRRLAAATSTAPAMAPRAPGTIGLCLAADAPMPEKLLHGLIAGLASCGKATAIRASDLPAEIRGAEDRAITDWIAGRERDLGRLLLITGEGHDDWDHAALRQCDFLLLCGPASLGRNGPVPLGAIESYAMPLFRTDHIELVLWRETSDEPIRETRNWLEGRRLRLHHHLALDSAKDMARLCRFLSGTALGAVFGGGGALGAGHLGVLRALEEAGAEFDIFGGTSIGSSVAIEMARAPGMSGKLDEFEEFFLKRRSLSRLTIPVYSVFDHHHFDAELRRYCGDVRLEDLPRNAFTISTNLSTNEIVMQRRGLCWQAIRASAAIPAALPPFITETGEVLVDGAIMDNVPLNAMRRIKTGPNIAVILSPEEDWRIARSYDSLPSRRSLAGQVVLRRREKKEPFPKIMEVVARAMMVTSSRTMRALITRGDLLLSPPAVPGMGLLDWKHIRAQEAAAYSYTAKLIEEAGSVEALLAGDAEASAAE